jgi:hypothetical protein
MLQLFLRDLIDLLPPLEVASTFGLVFFVLSWAFPRRLVALPSAAGRRSILIWTGTAGSLLVVAGATVASALAARRENIVYSGVDGWLGRPAPLLLATFVVAVAALVLSRSALPVPGDRAIVPRRSWLVFAPRPVLWVAAAAAILVALTALWQTAIATVAPDDGRFIGRVAEHSNLPIYMRFNQAYGYIAGVGWPNYLATLIALGIAVIVLIAALKSDANRPVSARTTMSGVRVDREQTARLLSLVLLGGLVTTLGAVWMHAGSIGEVSVGFEEDWVSDDMSLPRLYVGGGYDAFAGPMNLAGYGLQGIGVALLLRIAVDTVRSVLKRVRPAPDDSDGPRGSDGSDTAAGSASSAVSDAAGAAAAASGERR